MTRALLSHRPAAPAADLRAGGPGARVWQAIAEACAALHRGGGPGPLEEALQVLRRAGGAAGAALYLAEGDGFALRMRCGAGPALPLVWDAAAGVGVALHQPLECAGRREGLLILTSPRPEAAGGDFVAALRQGAEALGAALRGRRELAELRRLCACDPVTGLLAPRSFAERLEQEADRARRYGVALGLVLADVDRMAELNARHGTEAGDRSLAELARVLEAQSRRSDVLARAGGDELAWLLPEADVGAAHAAARRLLSAVACHAFPRVRRLSVSVGVASLPRMAAEGGELREAAERALGLAKKAGRNRVGGLPAPSVH